MQSIILGHLSVEDLSSFSSCSHYCFTLSQSKQIWAALVYEHYPLLYQLNPSFSVQGITRLVEFIVEIFFLYLDFWLIFAGESLKDVKEKIKKEYIQYVPSQEETRTMEYRVLEEMISTEKYYISSLKDFQVFFHLSLFISTTIFYYLITHV